VNRILYLSIDDTQLVNGRPMVSLWDDPDNRESGASTGERMVDLPLTDEQMDLLFPPTPEQVAQRAVREVLTRLAKFTTERCNDSDEGSTASLVRVAAAIDKELVKAGGTPVAPTWED
jgi:hypothetical protein